VVLGPHDDPLLKPWLRSSFGPRSFFPPPSLVSVLSRHGLEISLAYDVEITDPRVPFDMDLALLPLLLRKCSPLCRGFLPFEEKRGLELAPFSATELSLFFFSARQ